MDDRAGLQLIHVYVATRWPRWSRPSPVGGAGTRQVLAHPLVAQIFLGLSYVRRSGGVELIGDMGIGVEGIGVVG